jgi:hypothetical protein
MFKQKLDNKSRVFVNSQMRMYFKDFQNPQQDRSFAWIGYFTDFKTSCLIVMNRIVHMEKGIEINDYIKRNYQTTMFNVLDLESLGALYRGYGPFHEVEIKGNRIQLNKSDKQMLNLSDEEKSLAIIGTGDLYHIWNYQIFQEHFPDMAQFLNQVDGDDE